MDFSFYCPYVDSMICDASNVVIKIANDYSVNISRTTGCCQNQCILFSKSINKL